MSEANSRDDEPLNRQVNEVLSSLSALSKIVESAIEHVDQLPDLARGLDIGQHVKVALALKEARDLVSRLKPRLTDAQTKTDEFFAMRIGAESGATLYRTDTHTFSARGKCFVSPPSQFKEPAKFTELINWLAANAPSVTVDVTHLGKYTIEGLDEFCQGLLEDGKRLPPHTTAHMVDSVVITKRS